MEKGFYHPSRGYWQTTGEVSQRVLDTYPNGTIGVPVRPSKNHQWRNGAWVEVLPTPEEVAAELAAKGAARVEAIRNALDNQNSVNKVLLKIGFIQENRIRVLEGRPEITKEQFRTWVDNQID